MKGTGRRPGEPFVFLSRKKLERIHRFSLERRALFRQVSDCNPSPLPATLFRGLFPKSSPHSFRGPAPADVRRVLFLPTKLGTEICGGPGLSSLTSGCCSSLALRGGTYERASLPALHARPGHSIRVAGTRPSGGLGGWRFARGRRRLAGACALPGAVSGRRRVVMEVPGAGWEGAWTGRGRNVCI